MPKKKKSSKKFIHYVQLKTHRQFPNPINYYAHLNSLHSKIQPSFYTIQSIVNNQWIQIQRPLINQQFEKQHQEEIRKLFQHQKNLIDYKFICFNDEFDENNRFLREVFNRKCQITDQLIDLYQQIEHRQKQIYEYRVDILKSDFEKDKYDFKNLFINQHFKEFNNEIDILISLEQNDYLQQLIQFKLQKKQIDEIFFKNLNNLQQDFHAQFHSLQLTIQQISYSNRQQTSILSKLCHQLIEKSRLRNEKIEKDSISIEIVKRKIEQTKNSIENITGKKSDISEKLIQLKQCSNQQSNLSLINKSTDIQFRRLVVLIDKIVKECRRKLDKVQRLILLINQCEKFELENEKLYFSSLKTLKIDSNQLNFLSHCHLQIDSFFDQLTLFWKRFAYN